ncbi:MAG: hypothetical protein ACREOL_06850 [Candidatus Dormibacteria bacterium]
MSDPEPETDQRDLALVVSAMVEHVLQVAATWPDWDGRPRAVPVEGEAEPRLYSPHKALRRVADHMLDHLAELEMRLAGLESEPDAWHGSMVTSASDLTAFSAEDLDEARSRLLRLGLLWALRLRALSSEQLDARPDSAWSFRQLAFHVAEAGALYADPMGPAPR